MIVCVCGRAQSGKDSFADIARLEFNAVQNSFARAVKEEVSDFLEEHDVVYRHANLWGSNADKEATLRIYHYSLPEFIMPYLVQHGEYSKGWWYFKPRTLMQYWGTEYRRTQDTDYWVKRCMKGCRGEALYVISDGRFPNEVAAVKASKGIVVHVHRPALPAICNASHPSETALDGIMNWDYVITNDGTLKEYQDKVRKVLREVCK